MGYRSDILIAVAFKTKTQRDEIWAVYCMDPRVQEHNLAAQWKHTDDDAFTPIAYYEANNVKWYDNYEDVQGIEHLLALVEEFNENRQMPFAYIKYRIGEELTDTEVEAHSADDHESSLMGALWERASIERRIEHSF
jgi:hypothetical protein